MPRRVISRSARCRNRRMIWAIIIILPICAEGTTTSGCSGKTKAPRTIAVRGRHRFGSFDAVVAAVVTGMGIAQLAAWLVAEQLQSGDVTAILEEWRHWRSYDGCRHPPDFRPGRKRANLSDPASSGQVHPRAAYPVAMEARLCSMSAMISSICSIPTDRRT